MKNLYVVLRNFLLFFFLVNVFSGVSITQGLFGKVLVGLIFGVLMALVPTILAFFKLPVNFGGSFLLSLVICFIYFFLIKIQFLALGSIGGTTVNWGISGVKPWVLDDLTTLVVVSITSALLSVWLDYISSKRK
jgi:hypothetical protein